MLIRRLWQHGLRLAFHLFYNPFAFTYDWVSAVVSRGRWRAWTRVALPHLSGTRILEIPCGTGNLLLDLVAAGYHPLGVDLSASMLRLAHGKLRPAQVGAPLLRARAQALPFPDYAFDSIVMTFPPGFVHEPPVLAEFRRVLARDGRLIWVDAGRLLPRDAWSRILNRSFDVIEGKVRFEEQAGPLLRRAGFEPKFEMVQDEVSAVMVATAIKTSFDNPMSLC